MSARGRRAGERAPEGERSPRANGKGGGDPKLPPRGPASPAGWEPGLATRRPRTRAPAAPGQRTRTSSSGRGRRWRRRRAGSEPKLRRGSASAGELHSGAQRAGRGPGPAAGTVGAPALALTGGPLRQTPGSLVQFSVRGGSPGWGPPPRGASLGARPPARPPRPPAPAPAPGPRFLRHRPCGWGIPPGSSCKGAGPGRRWSLPPSEASAINRAPCTASARCLARPPRRWWGERAEGPRGLGGLWPPCSAPCCFTP